MRHLIKGHVRSQSLFLECMTTGKKEWARTYRRPNWGLSLVYTDLANPEMLGKALSFFPYLDFPLWVRGSGARGLHEGVLFFRVGTGVGWIEKPFDRLENPKNNAIGSRGNVTFSFMLHGQWTIAGRWGMSAGLGFDHYSNMAIRMPNLGINLPSARLGVHRSFGAEKELPAQEPIPEEPLDSSEPSLEGLVHHATVIGAGGVKAASPPNGRLFPAFSLMGLFGRELSQKSDLGLGVDLEWNRSLRYMISEDGSEGKDLPLTHDARVGVKAGYGMKIGSLKLIGQWGAYLHNEHSKVGAFYHRFGLRYRSGSFLVNGTLKTHFAKADHFEIGVGYRFLEK